MESLRICYVTSELAPFVKAGGLADVSAALPAELHRAGHDIRVIVPLYSRIDVATYPFRILPELQNVPVRLGRHNFTFTVLASKLPDTSLDVYFVHCPELYERDGLYTSDEDEHLRFLLLSRAALEACQRWSFAPDVVHANDWQTALLPLLIKTTYAWDRLFQQTRSLLTIHNLGYQGVFSGSILAELEVPDAARYLDRADLAAGRINFLKTGLLHADFLSTVSPTYAREIQTEAFGMGLEGLLRSRSESLVGILNGVDYSVWSPENDTHLAEQYSADNLDGKTANRRALLAALGLKPAFSHAEAGGNAVPVIGLISRFAYQKGLDLLGAAIPDLLARHDLRFALLGTGEPQYEELFRGLQKRYPGVVCFYNGYSNGLAHLIEAGSDLFVMPSRYEPCGLNQMYSLRYGTVPVVRRTGGLADTVEPFDPASGRGTGFLFDHFTADGLVWAVERALEVWRHPGLWQELQRNGMARDYSWPTQAGMYAELYRRMSGAKDDPGPV
jgi:starch synthase